ncbi:MAG TPA: hypothetical protein VGK50_07780 [Coriobacteriia bacterium]|jgi:hypothetical protein
MPTDDIMRFFALWMLTHETADEGLKAAVERGASVTPEGMSGGPDAFVDGLAAMVAQEKERLKAELASGAVKREDAEAQRVALEELRFEVASLRGRTDELAGMLETALAKLDAVAKRG